MDLASIGVYSIKRGVSMRIGNGVVSKFRRLSKKNMIIIVKGSLKNPSTFSYPLERYR
jgi:hypothetical protein